MPDEPMTPERRAEILGMATLRGGGFYALRAAEVAALCTALESSERRVADLRAAIAQAVETTQEIRMSGYPRSWVAVDSEAWSALLSATAPPAEQPATGDAVDTWEGPRLPKDRISYGVGEIIWSGPRPDLVIEDEAGQSAQGAPGGE